MKKLKPTYVIRSFVAGDLLEIFLISAVSAVIAIRVFLYFAGYPQLGAGSVHFAHMLWGGFLMLLALILLLSFLNKEVKYVAAILGGLGFGAFIDELGKFITSDNDYFFEPTFAFMYLIFIFLFLLFRSIEKAVVPTKTEYLINTLEIVKEIVIKDFDEFEKERAMTLLGKCDPKDPVVKSLKRLLKRIETIPEEKDSFWVRISRTGYTMYQRMIQSPLFAKLIMFYFILTGIIVFLRAILYLQEANGFWEWGQLIAALVIGSFILLGLNELGKQKRLEAFQYFTRAVLVSILVYQFFQFYHEQLLAVIGLGLDLVTLSVLQYAISEEKHLQQKRLDPISRFFRRVFKLFVASPARG